MLTKLAALSWLGFACGSFASTPNAKDLQFFQDKVQPVLAENCYKCHSHSAEKIKGGLVLDSLAGLLKGGDSGPALVPGKPDESLIIKAIHQTDENLQMPPKGKKLSTDKIADLEKWVQMGAPWPGAEPGKVKVRGKITDEDRAWWAFQPVRDRKVPVADDSGWWRNPIDRFVLDKLRFEGIEPSQEADRRTLIRRLYFDLWGLPPSPEEINAFSSDGSPRAYETLVDRLLDNPHYGERWARHWLDLVRYAESDGYKADSFRPQVWRYRDYVIKSLNEDKPYDKFVREQLAGDELAPGDPDAIVGTMFLRHGIYEYNNPDAKGQWEAILNELTDVTGDVFIGVGMSCARCHDHKFDPILQKDYYRLQAFFTPIALRDDLVVATAEERSKYGENLVQWEEMTKEIRSQIETLEEEYRRKNLQGAARKFPEDIQEILLKTESERTPYEEQIAQLAYRQVAPAFEQIETKLKGEQKQNMAELRKKLAEFEAFKPQPLPLTVTVSDVGPTAPPTFIPKSRNKEAIAPGFLTLLQESAAEIKPVSTAPNSTGRRTALAQWLTQPDNPLTTRVVVNRIWQHHFGRGIVSTASDFGKLGQPPSHPELLDWLTSKFIREGWSFKKLHRLILTSATYRQSSTQPPSELALKKDPENILLWRMSPRRLDADQVRDAILAASNELDFEMGGPSVDASKPRRSIYTKVRRNTHDPLLQAFDAPDNLGSTPQRNITTTPTQALLMFNSQAVMQRAKALTSRLKRSQLSSDADLVSAAFKLTLGREPESWEASELTAFLHQQTERIIRGLSKPKPVPFLAEPLPARDGKAAVFDRDGAQNRFEVPNSPSLPDQDFTIEAIVLVKSVNGDGAVRTIASQWNGAKTQSGWSFGVTGKKSSHKPQHLVLQLSSSSAKGGSYEEIFSDLAIDLNKTYYVAVSVRQGETNQSGVTFYAKNLANDEDPLQVTHAAHQLSERLHAVVPFTIGSVATDNSGYQFQGLIDEVRLTRKALAQEKLMVNAEGPTSDTVGYWQLKSEKDFYKDRSAHGNHIKVNVQNAHHIDPRTAALEDLCHVLFNANEFFYVD